MNDVNNVIHRASNCLYTSTMLFPGTASTTAFIHKNNWDGYSHLIGRLQPSHRTVITNPSDGCNRPTYSCG